MIVAETKTIQPQDHSSMAMTNPNPPPITSRVSPKTIHKAVSALLKWRNSKSETQKPQLLEHEEYLYLILTLKKIPSQSRMNPHKIPLPHALHSPHLSQELCLIVDDRPHSNLNKALAKSKIESEQIPVSKVIKLSKLKSDYRPFEAKRKLCDSYDMFFTDKRIVPLLPGLLGKHFYKKKKIPVPVDLKHKNWKEQIEKGCSSALLFLKTGTCSVVKVARVSMEEEEIVENVVAAINGIAEIVPRKWGGVRSLHLKLLESLALPLYQAVPDVRLRIEGVKEEEKGEGEVLIGAGKKGEKVGKKGEKLGKKRGRIHEVRYMDGAVGEVLDEDEMGTTNEIEGRDVGEGEDSENGEIVSGELGSKKRKKGDKAEERVSKESKHVKMPGKLKNKDGLTYKRDGSLAAKGKKEDGIKKRKVGLPVEDGESGGKEKKSTGLLKSKSGETKVKAKKSKKAVE
jgi:ribosome biogenesis protein UTP30